MPHYLNLSHDRRRRNMVDDASCRVEVEYVHSTEKAHLVQAADGHRVWLPVSQIRDEYVLSDKMRAYDIPEWLGREKGLI